MSWNRERKREKPPIKIKRMAENSIMPTRGTPGSGGADLYAVEDGILWPGDIKGFRSGIAMEIPEGYAGILMTRSSYGKIGVRVAAGANCIDADYRGEILVYLRNDGTYPFTINKGDRIAQLVIVKLYDRIEFEWADELSETKRGTGGFGSTGR